MNNSKRIYDEAQKYIPGGVNSPVRAFKSVGLNPIFIESANGAYIKDVDGNEYLDYICSWGPLILGHSNKEIIDDIAIVIAKGTSYGVPTEIEVEMAKEICEAYSSVDMVRMVNSGTEATMSALRVARAYTKKDKILKFEGCYHGHSDALLVKSGSGTLTYGVPTSPGVPEGTVKDTLVGKYNDIENLREIFDQNDDIAAVIIEAVAGNMGVVSPDVEFLNELRNLCSKNNTVLIFDEVITGFRLAYGGAAEVFSIEPDMACFGKIIGGGLPVGAYGGKKHIMEMVSPVGNVYQAGTLSGNPLAMHMGLKTLRLLKNNKEIYSDLEKKAIFLQKELDKIIKNNKYPVTTNRVKGMFCLFFTEKEPKSFEDVMKADTEKYSEFFKKMLEKGVLLPPAQFEGWFMSTCHTEDMIKETIDKVAEALKEIF